MHRHPNPRRHPSRATYALAVYALAAVLALAACGGPSGTPVPDPGEGEFTAVAQFSSPEARDGDRFGTGLALGFDQLLVGAPYAAGVSAGAAGAGAAWPYALNGAPTPGPRFADATGMNNDVYGAALALDDGFAFIGSPGDDEGASDAGSVWVHRLESGTWSLVTRLAEPSPSRAGFGARVAAHGGRLLVAAPERSDGLGRTGVAHVFVRDGDTYAHEQVLRLPDGVSDDGFGRAVALRGDVAVVTSVDTHRAYVYERGAGGWTHRVTLGGQAEHVARRFGTSVAVGEGVLFVGAPAGFSPDFFHGEVYVFDRGATTWTQAYRFRTEVGSTVWFGQSLATDGVRLVVGTPAAAVDGLSGAGVVHVYPIEGNEVLTGQRLQAMRPAENARFGAFVAIDGDHVAVAAPNRAIPGEVPGEVVVFQR